MAQNIQHIVVLMMENRSFDHMLGFLKRPDYNIDGLTGTESNPTDPANPVELVTVSNDATDVLTPDPGHSFSDVNMQLFNNPTGPPPVGEPNRGFVYNYSLKPRVTPAIARNIMKCFNPTNLPVLTTLAQEFAICDRWFSSVPGPTWPNRFFAHSATSKGYLDNSQFNNYDMRSIFENLSDNSYNWRDYYTTLSQTWQLQRLQTDEMKVNFRSFSQFLSNARDGRLPNYSFIEPKYFIGANDQHPPHKIIEGERLIATVYNAVRSSPLWENTLLVITYDEHGGTYDHALPPSAVPPDGHTSRFGFDRLGVRVPAVLVSPFIPRRTIVNRAFDHTSIPATVKQVFGLPAFLTERDRHANTFSDIPALSSARTDTPARIDPPSRVTSDTFDIDSANLDDLIARRESGLIPSTPLTDFQLSLLDLADSLDPGGRNEFHTLRLARRIETEFDAELYAREVTERFLADVKDKIDER